METQITLLRVLQEREFERVGSSQPISVDVRIIAATNRDLEAAVTAGTFRQDMFYRLNVFPIQCLLCVSGWTISRFCVEHLVERYAGRAGKTFSAIRMDTIEMLQSYDWPGNMRELQNVIERAVILCEGETFSVDAAWLKRESRALAGRTIPLMATLTDKEKEMIEAALAESRGRISGPSGAAAKLGIPRQTLDSKIAGLGIDKRRFKAQSAI